MYTATATTIKNSTARYVPARSGIMHFNGWMKCIYTMQAAPSFLLTCLLCGAASMPLTNCNYVTALGELQTSLLFTVKGCHS